MTTLQLLYLFLSIETKSENPKDSRQDNTWILPMNHELDNGLKCEKKRWKKQVPPRTILNDQNNGFEKIEHHNCRSGAQKFQTREHAHLPDSRLPKWPQIMTSRPIFLIENGCESNLINIDLFHLNQIITRPIMA